MWLPGSPDLGFWALCGVVLATTMAAWSAMMLPIESDALRTLITAGCILVHLPLTLYYGLLIMCGVCRDCP